MANENEIQVLSKLGLQKVAEDIFSEVNTRITERIVDDIDLDSDGNHVPSAESVYNAINAINNIQHLVIADGDITKASITPNTKTVYMVRKTQNATEAVPYVYIKDIGFISACALSINDSIPDVQVMSNDDIEEAIAAAANSTKPNI